MCLKMLMIQLIFGIVLVAGLGEALPREPYKPKIHYATVHHHEHHESDKHYQPDHHDYYNGHLKHDEYDKHHDFDHHHHEDHKKHHGHHDFKFEDDYHHEHYEHDKHYRPDHHDYSGHLKHDDYDKHHDFDHHYHHEDYKEHHDKHDLKFEDHYHHEDPYHHKEHHHHKEPCDEHHKEQQNHHHKKEEVELFVENFGKKLVENKQQRQPSYLPRKKRATTFQLPTTPESPSQEQILGHHPPPFYSEEFQLPRLGERRTTRQTKSYLQQGPSGEDVEQIQKENPEKESIFSQHHGRPPPFYSKPEVILPKFESAPVHGSLVGESNIQSSDLEEATYLPPIA